uniref:Helicase ATP-binding domain-containing protein n=1 Tax=Pseudo-nitzschia australis TaxID=44445 RepID=A0A7S4AT84_9STRA
MSESESAPVITTASSSLHGNIASISTSEEHDAIDSDENSIHAATMVEMNPAAAGAGQQQIAPELPLPAVLPNPSPEQQKIIEAIHEGFCVTVKACAGSGKTTCMLQVASSLPPSREVLIITYNRALSDDCKARIQKLSMGHRVSVYTIHGLVTRVAGEVCNDDNKLIQMLDLWDNCGGLEMTNPVSLDLVMIDEAQDLRPLFHKCLSHIFGTACRDGKEDRNGGMQLCLVGDPKQLLYDFTTYGSDKASASFFLQPETYWGTFAQKRKWIQLPLSVSYRLTPNTATFCNLFWGTSMVGGNTASPNLPVEYLMKYPYPNTDGFRYDPEKLSTSFLAEVIDKHGPENVMFLAQSIKSVNMPIRVHINKLMKIKDQQTGLQKYNFHIKENARGFEGRTDWKNKVRVWTFCGSKGCEADVVVVFGFEVFSRTHELNQIGVALSRARERLLVIHGKKYTCGRCFPNPYYPILGNASSGIEQHVVRWGKDDSQLLRLAVPGCETERGEMARCALGRLAESGVIKVDFGSGNGSHSHNYIMPLPGAVVKNQCNVMYVASDFNYFSALVENKFLQYGTWETIAGIPDGNEHNQRIEYETNVQFATTKEDVSALYGEAVTYMLQWDMCKFVPNVETVVSNGIILLHPQVQYTESEIRDSLRAICCEELTEDDNKCFEEEFSIEKKKLGRDLIAFMNTRMSLKKKRVFAEGDIVGEMYFPVMVSECKSEDDDNQLNEFLPQIRSVYESETSSKKPFHWVYLANAVMAFSNYHEKFRQIGTDPDSYESWVNSEALLDGLERLRNTIELISLSSSTLKNVKDEDDKNENVESNSTFDGTCSFERELDIRFTNDDCIKEQNNGRTIVGVAGVCDWINEGAIRRNLKRQESKGGGPYDVDLLEIKFVHHLSNIHRLQVLVYCALYALQLNDHNKEKRDDEYAWDDCNNNDGEKNIQVRQGIECCRGMLYNARTEEMEICSMQACEAMDFLLNISQFKYNGKDRKEVILLEELAKKAIDDDEVSIASSYRPKRPQKRLMEMHGKTYYTALAVDDDVTPSTKPKNSKGPCSYRLLKRPRESVEAPNQAGTGSENDPIFLE